MGLVTEATPAAARLLATCISRGIRLEARAGRLRVSAPRGTVTREMREELAAHRDELLRLVRLLGPQPAGPSRCAGCGATYPGHPGALCFACDLGVTALPPSRAMPYLLTLRDQRGPAGRRGVRDGELRQWLRRQRAERRDVESDQVSWLEEVEPKGSA